MNKTKAALITSATAFLSFASSVMAQASPDTRRIIINRPKLEDRNVGFSTLGDAINKIVTVAFIIAIIMVLVMLIWGALEWIMSGGEKDSVGKARGKILNALIGLAVLAVAYAIYVVAGQFIGINPQNFLIPTPDPAS